MLSTLLLSLEGVCFCHEEARKGENVMVGWLVAAKQGRTTADGVILFVNSLNVTSRFNGKDDLPPKTLTTNNTQHVPFQFPPATLDAVWLRSVKGQVRLTY